MKEKIDIRHSLLGSIEKRWSGRSFSQQNVSDEHLEKLLEAARWSPSCYNEQPWRFLIARKESQTFEMLFHSLTDGNKAWADKASVLLLSMAKRTFSHNRTENRHAWHDIGLAMGQLGLQATDLGLNLHQMAGFDAQMVEQKLELPDEYDAVTITAIGYRGEEQQLEGVLLDKEKAPQRRKPIDEIAFFEQLKLEE